MGALDKRQKRYFEDPKRFADTWNALMFKGLGLIDWKELREGNPVLTHADEGGTLERISDVVMKRTADGNLLAVLVLGNQKKVDYSIPVKVLLEEALAYDKQVREIKRYNESLERGLRKFGTKGEFLYRFKKKDRLRPVSTLILYWDDEPWDGARSLKEMIDFRGLEEMRDLVPEFRIHLIEMSKVTHTEYFQTDMRSMVEYFKRRNDWKSFREYSEACEEQYELDEEGLLVMGELVNTGKFKYLMEERTRKRESQREKEADETKETTNIKVGEENGKQENGKGKGIVCKALDDLIEQGVERGIEQGMERGIKQGMERGMRQGKMLDLQNLMETLQLTLEQAMNALKIPQEERETLIKMMDN